ncbi:MAG: hypothetical protein CL920_22705 [Deltaproteobacteria bacterium]|nr:hypothetical protein [Deltaproteobacteria bacterium]
MHNTHLGVELKLFSCVLCCPLQSMMVAMWFRNPPCLFLRTRRHKATQQFFNGLILKGVDVVC